MPNPGCEHGEYYAMGSEKRRLTQAEVKAICDYYMADNSMEDVGAKFCISRTLVNRILREQRVPIRQHGGSRSQIDKWIDRQLSVKGPTILERRRAGEYITKIAETYGVSVSHMRNHIVKLQEQFERRMNGSGTREESTAGASRQAVG